MVEYEYPRLSELWDFWIITMNIERELGKKPEYINSSTEKVFVAFKENLTDEEKTKLDAVMSDVNVGLYPSSTDGYTVFKIKDIWDYRTLIEQTVTKKVKWLHFPPALPDGSHVMELWIEGTLSTAEKKKCKDTYAGLISE